MRISAHEACVKPRLRTRSDINIYYSSEKLLKRAYIFVCTKIDVYKIFFVYTCLFLSIFIFFSFYFILYSIVHICPY